MFFLIVGIVCLATSLFFERKWHFVLMSILFFILGFGSDDFINIVMFMLGIILLVVELYVPDFGVSGLIGYILMNYALWVNWQNMDQVLLFNLWILLLIGIVLILGFQLKGTIKISPNLILNQRLDDQAGFRAYKKSELLPDQEGIVVEDLRPVGKVKFQDVNHVTEANAELGYIKEGQRVVVSRIENGRVYVIVQK